MVSWVKDTQKLYRRKSWIELVNILRKYGTLNQQCQTIWWISDLNENLSNFKIIGWKCTLEMKMKMPKDLFNPLRITNHQTKIADDSTYQDTKIKCKGKCSNQILVPCETTGASQQQNQYQIYEESNSERFVSIEFFMSPNRIEFCYVRTNLEWRNLSG